MTTKVPIRKMLVPTGRWNGFWNLLTLYFELIINSIKVSEKVDFYVKWILKEKQQSPKRNVHFRLKDMFYSESLSGNSCTAGASTLALKFDNECIAGIC